MINKLLKLSKDLHVAGYHNEAHQVDTIIKEAIDWGSVGSWFRKRYDSLKNKFNNRFKSQKSNEEYNQEKRDVFEEMLQRKESGPPAERLYYWYAHPFDSGCSICQSRHGQIKTLAEWNSIGLPGNNNSTCTKHPNCNCFLIRMRPGGMPEVAKNDDGEFDISDVIGIGEDNTKKNMQSGIMFTGEQYFNDFNQST